MFLKVPESLQNKLKRKKEKYSQKYKLRASTKINSTNQHQWSPATAPNLNDAVIGQIICNEMQYQVRNLGRIPKDLDQLVGLKFATWGGFVI